MVIADMYLRQVSLRKSCWRNFLSQSSDYLGSFLSNLWVCHFWRSWLAMCDTYYEKWMDVYKLIRSLKPTKFLNMMSFSAGLTIQKDIMGCKKINAVVSTHCWWAQDMPWTFDTLASNLQVLAPTVRLAKKTCECLNECVTFVHSGGGQWPSQTREGFDSLRYYIYTV